MSLFDVKDFWSVSSDRADICGNNCLVTADIDNDGCDEILAGTYNGFLRIFRVDCESTNDLSFKPSHQLIETQLFNPILQVITGKFVSGSQNVHIGILHSRSIVVYSFNSVSGSTEHGNQFELKIVYEHQLRHSSHLLLYGRFGGVKNRDFLCAVALDGTLAFFEQESFIIETQLPMFLLPTPIIYLPISDVFVTLNANWCIDGYKYQMLVNTVGRKTTAAWSYNLGETIIDIQPVIIDVNQESSLVVVSQTHFICFRGNGNIRFAKRLHYAPLCFCAYYNEEKNKIMISLVTDSGILLIYEETSLRWNATLPLIPVAISRANLKSVKGSIVILSEFGEIKCCYLGTEPSLFVAPPLENSVTKYKDVSSKLEEVQKQLINRKMDNAEVLPINVNEREMSVNLKVTYDKELCCCQYSVDISPCGPLLNILVTFDLMPPFYTEPESHNILSLCEKTVLNGVIHLDMEKRFITPFCAEVTAVITYTGKNIVRKTCVIPNRFIFVPCKQTTEHLLKLSIDLNQPPIPLTTLFKELVDEKWLEAGCNDEFACFYFRNNLEKRFAVHLSKTRYAYEFESDALSTLSLVMKLMIWRCNNHHTRDKKQPYVYTCSYTPIQELFSVVDNHANIRNEIKCSQESLEKLTAQFRLIQRRMLVKLKDKIPAPVTSLKVLYTDIYNRVMEISHIIDEKQQALVAVNCELYANIDVAVLLLKMSASFSDENINHIRNALIPTMIDSENQGWEETAEAALSYVTQTILQISSKDNLHSMTSSKIGGIDVTRIKKLISCLFLNIDKTSYRKGQNRAVSPIAENDEIDDSDQLNVKEESGISTLPLLSKVSAMKVGTMNTEIVNWEWFGEV